MVQCESPFLSQWSISLSMVHSSSVLGTWNIYYIYIYTNGMPNDYVCVSLSIYMYAGVTCYNVMVPCVISTLATVTIL